MLCKFDIQPGQVMHQLGVTTQLTIYLMIFTRPEWPKLVFVNNLWKWKVLDVRAKMIRTDMKQLLTLIIAGSREERQQSEEQQHVAKETSCTHTVTSSRMFLVIFVVNFIIRGQLQQFLYKSIRIFLTIRSFCYLLGDDLLCLKCRWYNKSLLPPQLHLHLSVHNYLWSKSSLFLIENRPTTFHQDSDDSLNIGQP